MIIIWQIDNERMFRLVATVSIVDAALTLVIPLLHRLSKTAAAGPAILPHLSERSVASIDEEIVRLRARIADLEKLRSEIAGKRSGT